MWRSGLTGGLVLLLLIITSGFAIVRQSIHPYYIWAYYIRYDHFYLVSLTKLISQWGSMTLSAVAIALCT